MKLGIQCVYVRIFLKRRGQRCAVWWPEVGHGVMCMRRRRRWRRCRVKAMPSFCICLTYNSGQDSRTSSDYVLREPTTATESCFGGGGAMRERRQDAGARLSINDPLSHHFHSRPSALLDVPAPICTNDITRALHTNGSLDHHSSSNTCTIISIAFNERRRDA